MESKARVAGHAVHPMLIVFPLGLFGTAVAFDLITLGSGNIKFTEAAFYMMGAGIVGGLTAGVFGFIDWMAIPRGTRAKRIGMWHALGNLGVVGLFAGSVFLRWQEPATPSIPALLLSLAGAGLATITGWLGGELVERLGVSVDDNAGLNAPSSLHPSADSQPSA